MYHVAGSKSWLFQPAWREEDSLAGPIDLPIRGCYRFLWLLRRIRIATMDRSSLTRYAWLSIAAAIVTIGLKSFAYLLTGSVGLLSDAVESVVNLLAAIIALAMLIVAARPADEEHQYGHSKAEYFASGAEGVLILLAAVSIAVAAVYRLLAPRPVEQAGIGLAVAVVASAICVTMPASSRMFTQWTEITVRPVSISARNPSLRRTSAAPTASRAW